MNSFPGKRYRVTNPLTGVLRGQVRRGIRVQAPGLFRLPKYSRGVSSEIKYSELSVPIFSVERRNVCPTKTTTYMSKPTPSFCPQVKSNVINSPSTYYTPAFDLTYPVKKEKPTETVSPSNGLTLTNNWTNQSPISSSLTASSPASLMPKMDGKYDSSPFKPQAKGMTVSFASPEQRFEYEAGSSESEDPISQEKPIIRFKGSKFVLNRNGNLKQVHPSTTSTGRLITETTTQILRSRRMSTHGIHVTHQVCRQNRTCRTINN